MKTDGIYTRERNGKSLVQTMFFYIIVTKPLSKSTLKDSNRTLEETLL